MPSRSDPVWRSTPRARRWRMSCSRRVSNAADWPAREEELAGDGSQSSRDRRPVQREAVFGQRRDGVDDDAEAGGFGQQGRRAGLGGGADERGVGALAREDEDAGPRMALSQRPGCGDDVGPVEPQVHDHHVRFGLGGQPFRLVGVGGNGDTGQLGRRVDRQSQGLTEDRLAVDHHDRQSTLEGHGATTRDGVDGRVADSFWAHPCRDYSPNQGGHPRRGHPIRRAWAPWAGRAPARRRCCAGSRPSRPRWSRTVRRRRGTGGC